MRAFAGGGPAGFSLWRFFVHGHSLGIHIYFVNLPGIGNKCIDTLAINRYILCINTNEQQIVREMTMEAREQRGLVIAATARSIRRKGNLWKVPSAQPNTPGYLVNLEKQTCTCLDHQEGGHKCKHIYAAEIVYQREFEFNDDGTVTETETLVTVHQVRKTYPQNWRAYNAAQINEKAKFQSLLHDLCKGIEDDRRPGRGRPRIPVGRCHLCRCVQNLFDSERSPVYVGLARCQRKGLHQSRSLLCHCSHVLESKAINAECWNNWLSKQRIRSKRSKPNSPSIVGLFWLPIRPLV